MSYFFCNLVSLLLMLIYVIVSIAFFTLLERKSLGYIQDRKSPNKRSYGWMRSIPTTFLWWFKAFEKKVVCSCQIWVLLM